MSGIERKLDTLRPSASPTFAEKARRLIQPEPLKRNAPWIWSPGIGTEIWEMFCACIVGDIETVRELVARDPSLIRAHYEYRTPLSFAVRENQLQVAAFLLDRGALRVGLGDPVEMARDRGYTEMVALLEDRFSLIGASEKGEAVAEAIRVGDVAQVEHLLDGDPSLLHAGDCTSNQPIHWAVMSRQPEMIDLLLTRGADINAVRADGARPIMLTNGDYDYRGWRDVPRWAPAKPDEIYRLLVARGAYIDIGMAAAKGNIERVRELLKTDASLANKVSDYNSYYTGCGAPLKNAVLGGDIEIVKLLLQHGADPNLPEEGIAPNGHALYEAVAMRRHDIAKVLLEHGAKANAPVESSGDAVWVAINNGDREMLQLLGSHGGTWEISTTPKAMKYDDVLTTGVTPTVEVMAHFGDTERAAKLFRENPALANDPAALRTAAAQQQTGFVELLLQHHPDLVKRVSVTSPRFMAEMLITRGMDPNYPNWMGITPLHHAAGSGDVDTAGFLLDNGAEVHVRDEEYRSTPLAWAARQGQARTVRYLLRRGSRIHLPDDPPWADPISWATRRGHEGIVRILLDYKRTGKEQLPKLAELEGLAVSIVAAYAGKEGAADALQHVMKWFRIERSLNWDRAETAVQVVRFRSRIDSQMGRSSEAGSESLELEDARKLVAASEGFSSWAALERHYDANVVANT